ncbi:MAG: hypothetical protein KDB27_19975, partial [Planctomycetales bacterium]|nr:hypothetical protein [Planctomycetales bacterium]
DPGLLADFRDKFGDVFAEQFTANATQSLYLTNNSSFNATVERSPLIEQLRGDADSTESARHAFLATFGREPDQPELTAIAEFLKSDDPAGDRVTSLVWALITSAEFRFNH